MQRANWILKQWRELYYRKQNIKPKNISLSYFCLKISKNLLSKIKLSVKRDGAGGGFKLFLRLPSNTCQFIIIRKTCQFLLSNTSVYNSKINLGFVIHGVLCFKYLHAYHNLTNYGMYALKRVITTT